MSSPGSTGLSSRCPSSCATWPPKTRASTATTTPRKQRSPRLRARAADLDHVATTGGPAKLVSSDVWQRPAAWRGSAVVIRNGGRRAELADPRTVGGDHLSPETQSRQDQGRRQDRAHRSLPFGRKTERAGLALQVLPQA